MSGAPVGLLANQVKEALQKQVSPDGNQSAPALGANQTGKTRWRDLFVAKKTLPERHDPGEQTKPE